MSQRALILGVRDRLREAFPRLLGPLDCEVMPDGQPPNGCGETFVAVHPGGWTADENESLDEKYTVFVTVTMRARGTPGDRHGELMSKATTGLLAFAEAIRADLHAKHESIAAANQILRQDGDEWSDPPTRVNEFIEPLRFRSAGAVEKKGPSWVGGNGKGVAALSIVLTFADARRVQVIEEQT